MHDVLKSCAVVSIFACHIESHAKCNGFQTWYSSVLHVLPEADGIVCRSELPELTVYIVKTQNAGAVMVI